MKVKAPNFIIFFFVISSIAYSQSIYKDTLFLYKDSLKGSSQSIFVETNPSSKYYEYLTSFNFGLYDNKSYHQSLEYFKENKNKLKKKWLILPVKKWISLRQFQGNFYAYYPCDFILSNRISINDSTYINWTCEGPVGNKILNVKKLNATTYQIKTIGEHYRKRTIKIYMVDTEKGIAVFEEIFADKSKHYSLMIDAEKIKTVPLIVNNCEIEKQMEMEFEEPNFQSLIKKSIKSSFKNKR
jgi:hypothetical protein